MRESETAGEMEIFLGEDSIRPCEYQVRPGRYFDPPEYCDLDSMPGELYCSRHLAMIEGEWNEERES